MECCMHHFKVIYCLFLLVTLKQSKKIIRRRKPEFSVVFVFAVLKLMESYECRSKDSCFRRYVD